MKNFLKEFRNFIQHGNVIDMAVGVIFGAAFKTIIDALIKDVFDPILGCILSGIKFEDMKLVIKAAQGENPAVAIAYGHFIQVVISFILTAFVLFLLVRGYNKMRKNEEPAEEPVKGPSDNELLQDILAELRKKG